MTNSLRFDKIMKNSLCKENLSGRYIYHSTENNVDIYVRDGRAFGLVGDSFFLIYRNGFWFITNELYACNGKFSNKIGGFFRLKTKGNKFISIIHTVEVYKLMPIFRNEPPCIVRVLGYNVQRGQNQQPIL